MIEDLLSGFAFPIRNMPLVVQYFTYLNPLRYSIEIVRGIFLPLTGRQCDRLARISRKCLRVMMYRRDEWWQF